MAVDLVIACPIYARGYVIDEWISSVLAQDLPPKTHFLFALTPSKDRTEHVIARRLPDAEVITVEHFPAFTDSERDDIRRYTVLAAIRNLLLRRVASLAPAHYLSWDSDVLLEPDALRLMRDLDKPVVGAAIQMGGDRFEDQWSFMHLDADGWAERPVNQKLPEKPQRVDVVMAAKLMRPDAFRNLRYADNLCGEDVGFAIAARMMGVEMWLHPDARGRHAWRHG